MNILFVSYGEITNNTGSQFTVVARDLNRRGHLCIAAVPKLSKNSSYSDAMNLPCVRHKDLLSGNAFPFPNGQKADLIIAITPRQIIQNFLADYLSQYPTPFIVHLEDNEDELTERFTLRRVEDIRKLPHDQIHEKIIPTGLSCPLCWPEFLAKANAVTYIHLALRGMAPASMPSHPFTPPVDFDLFDPDKYRSSTSKLRQQFNIAADEKVISYTGNTHNANIQNIRTLYTVIQRLNQSGVKTRLLRTGHQQQAFHESLNFDPSPFTTELGFIAREQVPSIVALSDLSIMPTHADNYDNYRLPSSLPEHLAMGKCIITTRAGLGAQLQDGISASLVNSSDAKCLLARSLELLNDTTRRRSIESGAKAFAQQRFHPDTVAPLEQFYQKIANSHC